MTDKKRNAQPTPVATAFKDRKKTGPDESPVQVRPAGPESMHDAPAGWDEVDEAVDESFPASDPAAKY